MQNLSKHYKSIELDAQVAQASPHKLIQMLFDGAVERLMIAKGALERQDHALKGEMIGKAIAIIAGLRESLDKNIESELPHNLDRLYEYMQYRLIEANANEQAELLDEVVRLIRTIKSGWDEVAPVN